MGQIGTAHFVTAGHRFRHSSGGDLLGNLDMMGATVDAEGIG